MRSSLSVVLLFLCSCTRIAPWPELVERTIIFERDVPEAYRAAVMLAADKWNAAADSDLLIADDGKHECHVFVLISRDLGKPGRLGLTQPIAVKTCSFTVRLKPEMDPARLALTTAHETGHVLLGANHSDNEESVMYHGYMPGEVTDENPLGKSSQHITDEELSRLDARMRGHDFSAHESADDECYEP